MQPLIVRITEHIFMTSAKNHLESIPVFRELIKKLNNRGPKLEP